MSVHQLPKQAIHSTFSYILLHWVLGNEPRHDWQLDREMLW